MTTTSQLSAPARPVKIDWWGHATFAVGRIAAVASAFTGRAKAEHVSSEPTSVRLEPPEAVPETAIAGTVARADGAPAAGVTVTALDAASAVAGTTVTGTDGRYRLWVPGPGAYVVVAAGLRAREVSLDARAAGASVLLTIGGRS